VDLQLIYSHNEHLSEKKLNPTKPFLKDIKGGWRIQNILSAYNKFLVKRKLKRGVDIFHPTYFDTYFLNSLNNAKFIFTIYDMIHEKKMVIVDKAASNNEIIENKKLLAKSASKIIAISESTKKDIVDIYGIDESKVEVIYLSASLTADLEYIPTIQIPKQYILFVGIRKGYKNFKLFVEAVAPLIHSSKNLFIVCAGGGKFTLDEFAELQKLGIAENVIQVGVDDNILAFLYRNALCFVFPSLYEGFGIPTLEALTCGCPVVLSNTSSMPEVGGDAVVYIDPYSKESIFHAIKEVIESNSLQMQLKEKGYLQAKKFSWDKCAEEHYKLYKSLL
jgi:glycosyltransferase involved in cell wall biosynthesis